MSQSETPKKIKESQAQANKPNFILVIKVLHEDSHKLGNKIRCAVCTRMKNKKWEPQKQQTSQFYWKRIDGQFSVDDAAQLVSDIQTELKAKKKYGQFHGNPSKWELTHLLLNPLFEGDNQIDLAHLFGN